jgi:hypothetical protein
MSSIRSATSRNTEEAFEAIATTRRELRVAAENWRHLVDSGKRLKRLYPQLTALQRFRLIRSGLADDSVDPQVMWTLPRSQVPELYGALTMFRDAVYEIALPAIVSEPEIRALERGVSMLELMGAWAADHELLTSLGRYALASAPDESERYEGEDDADRLLRHALEINDHLVPRPLDQVFPPLDRLVARRSEDEGPDAQMLARQLRVEAQALWSRLRTYRTILDEVRATLEDEELLEDLLSLEDLEASLLALRDRLQFVGPFEFDEPGDDELDALRISVGL